jgi:hypothetical protein
MLELSQVLPLDCWREVNLFLPFANQCLISRVNKTLRKWFLDQRLCTEIPKIRERFSNIFAFSPIDQKKIFQDPSYCEKCFFDMVKMINSFPDLKKSLRKNKDFQVVAQKIDDRDFANAFNCILSGNTQRPFGDAVFIKNWIAMYSYKLEDKDDLTLNNLGLDSIPLSLFLICSTMKKIDLSYNRIHFISNDLMNLNTLTEVKLKNNQITNVDGIEKFSNLGILDLSHNLIEKITPFEKLSKLKELYLSHNKISNISIKNVEGVEKFSNLGILDLSHNLIEKITAIEKLSKLRELYLSHNKISNIPIDIVFLKLNILDIDNNLFKDPQKVLYDFSHIPNLKASREPIPDNPIAMSIILGSLVGFYLFGKNGWGVGLLAGAIIYFKSLK